MKKLSTGFKVMVKLSFVLVLTLFANFTYAEATSGDCPAGEYECGSQCCFDD